MEDNKRSNRKVRKVFRKRNTPEPLEKENRGVVYWGKDNLYPQCLVGWAEDNPVHGGILEQKITFISSAGLEVSGLPEEIALKIQDFAEDITRDTEYFNGFAILFRKVGDNWVPEHVDFETIRYSEDLKWFKISDDWSNKSQSKENTNLRTVKNIKYAKLSGEDGDKEVLLYCKVKPKQRILKNKKLTLGHYPVPGYISASIPIQAGIEQDYFTLSEVVNGYKGGTLVSMNNGTPETDEKADEIADEIKGEATDRDSQGGIVVTFADGQENAPTVQQLNGNDLDKRYIESNKEIRNKILIGHQAGSATLFGVNSESLFGSKEEMEVAYKLLSNNYIPKRHRFMSGGIEYAYQRLGVKNVSINFKKYQLDISGNDQSQVEKTYNSKDKKDPVLTRLSKMGVERKSSIVFKSRSYDFESDEIEFIKSFSKFANLTENQQLILRLINDGKTFSEISKVLGKGPVYLSLELLKLNSMGLLKGWQVKDPSSIDLEVRYSYEVKAGLGPQIISGTREFCRDLIELDRLYTRQEIDQLSNEMETDVWRYRGGWYTNPQTGKSTPSCRHEWRQNIVSK